MIFSYLSYYVIKPEGRTNYGALIDPRAYPIPELGLTTLEGSSAVLEQFKGICIEHFSPFVTVIP